MRVFNASEVPDSHKIKVYDALCAYFLSTLPSYYTEDSYVDLRYDSGVANEATEVIGLDVDGGEIYVNMAIKGWAGTHCFGIELPEITRESDYGESAGIEIE